ncbi:MAG TPA: NAD(P)/FAD-dependent oxidoreductase [Patescibacteria group bacterium]|nr:NAD(P)/FAD-dependent oxidoreductase [Patescibacteria group bacterium]
MMKKICIIGGGAAGMMAAATICQQQTKAEVTIIEKNALLGRKVIISGGGRCNVTTGMQDIRQVLTHYPRGNTFLATAMRRFPPNAVIHWFESHGVPLKTEKDLRVFPQSNNGKDIVTVFEQLYKKSRVTVRLQTTVESIKKEQRVFHIILKDGSFLKAEAVILATGGTAYRNTGSTGDGYAFAKTLGHTLTPIAPSLNALTLAEHWPKKLAGLSLPHIALQTKRAKTILWKGAMIFTHTGISGPAVFAFSSLIAFEKFDHQNPLPIFIDFLPETPFAQIEYIVRQETQLHPAIFFKNTIHRFLPTTLCEVLCQELQIDLKKRNAEVSKKELHYAIQWIKRCSLHIVARSNGTEFITAGGVNLKEINPKTMESRLCPGLFFAGEILNIDGFTGGFNLQAAWATGKLAGESACQ